MNQDLYDYLKSCKNYRLSLLWFETAHYDSTTTQEKAPRKILRKALKFSEDEYLSFIKKLDNIHSDFRIHNRHLDNKRNCEDLLLLINDLLVECEKIPPKDDFLENIQIVFKAHFGIDNKANYIKYNYFYKLEYVRRNYNKLQHDERIAIDHIITGINNIHEIKPILKDMAIAITLKMLTFKE